MVTWFWPAAYVKVCRPAIWLAEVILSALALSTWPTAYQMTATAKTTTTTAAAISPHGRCWATTCVVGRVRPPEGRPLPVAGVRSLGKASPRSVGRGVRPSGPGV